MAKKTNCYVTGYALKEGHGHYYFEALLKTTDRDSLDSIGERAYTQWLNEHPEYPSRKNVTIEGVNLKHLDESIWVHWCGEVEEFHPDGPGAYPYDCIAKDKHPNAVIYTNYRNHSWVPDYELKKLHNDHYEIVMSKE